MPELIAVDELRAYLLSEGVGQEPGDPPGPLPSLWLKPRDGGIPAPRDGEAMTITLVDAQLGSPSSMSPWLEEAFVEVTTRSRSHNEARLVHRWIRGRLAPEGLPGGRRQWMMGGLFVEYSLSWLPERELPSVDGDSYVRRAGFVIAARTKVLRGETYP